MAPFRRWHGETEMNVEYVLTSSEAEGFVRNSLVDALGLQFSHLVASSVSWSGATYRIFGRVNLAATDLADFRHGGKVDDRPRPGTWLVDSLKKVSAKTKASGFVLTEDWRAKPVDERLKTFAMPAVFHGNEVYFAIDQSEIGTSENWNRIVANFVPVFHGFLIRDRLMPAPGSIVSTPELSFIAAGVTAIFVGVFDGESYLLCELSH